MGADARQPDSPQPRASANAGERMRAKFTPGLLQVRHWPAALWVVVILALVLLVGWLLRAGS